MMIIRNLNDDLLTNYSYLNAAKNSKAKHRGALWYYSCIALFRSHPITKNNTPATINSTGTGTSKRLIV